MAGTIFLCLSRGGMTAFGCEVVFLAAVLWWKNASRRSAAIFAAACLLILVFLLWLGGKNLVQRFVSFKTDDASYHTRVQIARDSIPMIRARPLTGWGLGTFTTVYPKYRTFYAEVFINAAHNDYVQVLTETGLLGFAAVLGFLAVVFVRAFRKLRAPGLDLTQAATLAALLAVTGILVQFLREIGYSLAYCSTSNFSDPLVSFLFGLFAWCLDGGAAGHTVPCVRTLQPK